MSDPARTAATILAIAALTALAGTAAASHAGPGTWDGAAGSQRLPVPHDHGDDWDPAVAADGSLAAVGDADGNEVWIFRRDGADWRPAGHLPPNGSHASGAFGAAVAVDDGRILVGVPGEDVESPNGSYGGIDAGSAYLYAEDGDGNWSLEHRFLGEPRPQVADYLGRGVALEGDVAAVGAPSILTGDVHVFRRDADGTWGQEDRLVGELFDGLGTGLDLGPEADLLVAGAPGLDGALSWRHQDGGSWTSAGPLEVPTDSDDYWVGWDVAVAGNATALGARQGGEAWVFHPAETGWTLAETLPGPADATEAFGRSVAGHGDHVAVGDPGVGNGTGAVTVHVRGDDGAWTPSTSVVPGGASAGDEVGVDAALTRDALVAGSRDAGTSGTPATPSAFAVAPDRDGDGLGDWREEDLATDPTDPDSDEDGLEDGPEVEDHGIDPLDRDTDGDLHMDGTEVRRGSDPADPISVPLPSGGSTPSTGPTRGQEIPGADDRGPVR